MGLSLLLGAAPGALAIGLYQEWAPWYASMHPDTVLVLETGATLVTGDDGATLFSFSLSAIQRGPFQFAASWGAVFSRFGDSQSWGMSDPKVYARLRLPLPARAGARFFIEGTARLPVAGAELFPYAFGAQDLELMGVLELLRGGLRLGGGRQMTEPPSNSDLTSMDVPHANHFWGLLSRRRGELLLQARGEAMVFELEGRARWLFMAQVLHGDPQGLTLRFTARGEAGPDRLYDGAVEIAFATGLR